MDKNDEKTSRSVAANGTKSDSLAEFSNFESHAEPLDKDEKYWIQGDFLVFQVGKTLFRLPSYQFMRHSVVFADMFCLPQGDEKDGGRREGRSEDKSIILPETITAQDFRTFLKAIYPQNPSKNIWSGLSKEELISILKLSTMWYFLEHRADAIATLSPLLSPAEKIAIGRKYKIVDFMKDGFKVIVTRDQQITDEEGILMDLLTALALSRLREAWRFPGSSKAIEYASYLIEKYMKDELGLIR